MRLVLLLTLFLCPFALLAQVFGGKISPEAQADMAKNGSADVLVIFREKADLNAAQQLKTKAQKAHFVFDALQKTAARSQKAAGEIVRAQGANARTLFIVNALAIDDCRPELAQLLAELPEVSHISTDPWVFFDAPFEGDAALDLRGNEPEWGIKMIRADEMWKLGYSGQGITVGGADTGYDWQHPALRGKYRGTLSDTSANHHYNWHDAIHDINPLNGDTMPKPQNNPCGLDSKSPCDDHNHGTHTMGTMVGKAGDAHQIGVAPSAKWVACRNMERGWGKPSTYLECFQWFLAPTDLDGKNPDVTKAPHVINNSWYCSKEEGCTDLNVNKLLHDAVIALKKSGVVVVVSNGNFGPNCRSGDVPAAYFEESFSVGATRNDDSIAHFSSRGPVGIDGSLRMKPNVSAPGQDVRSCVRNGNYATYSGTSMAGPHVAGAVALLLSARPDLIGKVDQIETIIERSAMPKFDALDCDPYKGSERPNPIYGWGRIDVLAALAVSTSESPENQSIVLNVSPNPVRDVAIFECKNAQGRALLELFSAEGKLLLTKQWIAAAHDVLTLEVSHLPNACMVYRLTTEQGVISGKLLKN